MHTLERTVRIHINPADPSPVPSPNGFAGSPTPRGLSRYYEFHVHCRGEPDPETAYLIDIKRIDNAVHAAAVPILAAACKTNPAADPESLLPGILDALAHHLGTLLHSARWSLTPYYSIEMTAADRTRYILRQQFDFSAAHRLHAPALSDDDNRALYGKCNNPSGHGHNYRVEPAVSVSLDPALPPFTVSDLERLTQIAIIDRFDHKHLNLDTREFASESGLNPSVENIAKVCFDLLAPAIASDSAGDAELRAVTVWETDRTSSTYPAQ